MATHIFRMHTIFIQSSASMTRLYILVSPTKVGGNIAHIRTNQRRVQRTSCINRHSKGTAFESTENFHQTYDSSIGLGGLVVTAADPAICGAIKDVLFGIPQKFDFAESASVNSVWVMSSTHRCLICF